MILQTFMIECLKMYKISNKINNFITNTVENWRVELTGRKQTPEEVKIQRCTFHRHTLIWFVIKIIIIMSRHQHGYPWPSLATPPYRRLLPEGLQNYIPYRHRAAVSRFELVILPLCTLWLVITIMPHNYVLRKCIKRYKFTKSH